MPYPTIEEEFGAYAPWPWNWICMGILFFACVLAFVICEIPRRIANKVSNG